MAQSNSAAKAATNVAAGGCLAALAPSLIIFIAFMLITESCQAAFSGSGSRKACQSDLFSLGMIYPVDPENRTIKEKFEPGEEEGDDPKHASIEFDSGPRTEVVAVAKGWVIKADGDTVIIQHKLDIQSWYTGLGQIDVDEGEDVERGAPIGRTEWVSATDIGNLEFEVHLGATSNDEPGKATDPMDFLTDAVARPDDGGRPAELIGNNEEEQAFNFFVEVGYSPEQAAGIVGNMIAESGVKPMRLQDTTPETETSATKANGYTNKGWGIVQWTPPSKYIQPMLDRGRKTNEIESLLMQLQFVADQLDGKGPAPEKAAGDALWAQRTAENAAYTFAHRYERFKGHENPNHPTYAERKRLANEILKTYGAGACAGGPIVDTALSLAWPDKDKGKVDVSEVKDGDEARFATDRYQKAMKEHNGESGSYVYTDCGVFVATVMRMSKADPDYPKRGTDVQYEYLQSQKGKKYDFFPLPVKDGTVDTGQLRKGDILITLGDGDTPGHTYIYTGPFPGDNDVTYNSVSASLRGHTPNAGHVYVGKAPYYVARLKTSMISEEGAA